MTSDVAMTAEELSMARHLVQALNLQGVEAGDIAPDSRLFGDSAGSLGLDSIDALEIALMVQQQYGVEMRSDDDLARNAFASLRSLTRYVLGRRAAAGSLPG